MGTVSVSPTNRPTEPVLLPQSFPMNRRPPSFAFSRCLLCCLGEELRPLAPRPLLFVVIDYCPLATPRPDLFRGLSLIVEKVCFRRSPLFLSLEEVLDDESSQHESRLGFSFLRPQQPPFPQALPVCL